MANHQTNFTSNFGEMGETGNAAFVLNINGVSHTYHPIGSDVNVDVATVRRILATAPNLVQSIAAVLTAGGYPILVYDGSEYGYIKTANSRYVFTCLDSLNGVKQAEVDTQDGTITAGTGGVDGVSILSRTDSDLFLKITTALTLGRMPIILDSGTYYHLIAKTSTVAQFGRITAAGALEVLTVNNSDQITSSSFAFVQDQYYVHTDNNFTDAYKAAVEANTTARHTHANKPILDGIEQTDIDNWDGKLSPTGDVSNTASTFTKASDDTSTTTSGSKLSAIFTAISSFFASLKALAFKDKVSDSDISGTISDSHITSVAWSKVSNKPTKLSDFTDDITKQTYIASGTGSDKPASGAAVAQAVSNRLVRVTPGDCTYGYTLLFTATMDSSNKAFISFVVSATKDVYNVKIIFATLGINYSGEASINAWFTTLADSESTRFKLAYKYIGQSGSSRQYEIWLIDTYSTGSASRRVSFTIINQSYLNSVESGNSSQQSAVAELTDFSQVKQVYTDGQKGSTSIPVYVDSNGQVKPCTPSSMTVGHASALTPSGNAGQVLISNGSGTDPSWATIANATWYVFRNITSVKANAVSIGDFNGWCAVLAYVDSAAQLRLFVSELGIEEYHQVTVSYSTGIQTSPTLTLGDTWDIPVTFGNGVGQFHKIRLMEGAQILDLEVQFRAEGEGNYLYVRK